MPNADAFTGKHHSELFFPFEVFEQMMSMTFTTSGAHRARQEFTPDVRRIGLPPDFWLRLEAITAAFRADDASVRALLRRRDDPKEDKRRQEELALKYDDYCRDRASALELAREEFGRERFDRFMYEVIAYRMFNASDKLPDPKVVRWAAGGCR